MVDQLVYNGNVEAQEQADSTADLTRHCIVSRSKTTDLNPAAVDEIMAEVLNWSEFSAVRRSALGV